MLIIEIVDKFIFSRVLAPMVAYLPEQQNYLYTNRLAGLYDCLLYWLL